MLLRGGSRVLSFVPFSSAFLRSKTKTPVGDLKCSALPQAMRRMAGWWWTDRAKTGFFHVYKLQSGEYAPFG